MMIWRYAYSIDSTWLESVDINVCHTGGACPVMILNGGRYPGFLFLDSGLKIAGMTA
jgi:hypothetical protein